MAKWAAPALWPAQFATFDPAAWVDRLHWALARWDYWLSHPEVQRVVDPVGLIAERVAARRGEGSPARARGW